MKKLLYQVASATQDELDDLFETATGLPATFLRNNHSMLYALGLIWVSDQLAKIEPDYGQEPETSVQIPFIDELRDANKLFDEKLSGIPKKALCGIADAYMALNCILREDHTGLSDAAALGCLQRASFNRGIVCGILEASSTVSEDVKKAARSQIGKQGADATHAPNRAAKAKVFDWLDENCHPKRMKLKDAAEAVSDGKLVPTQYDTVRKWVTEWRSKRFPAKK